MTAQGRAKRRSGIGDVAKIMGLVLLGLIALAAAWKIGTWGYYRTAGYDIIGQWRAEQTSVMGVDFPVGVNIEFTHDSATILDTKMPVSEYEREKNKVRVFLRPDQRAQVNLTFVFEDNDHMTFDGPLGVTLRYRRIKGAP